MNRPWSGLRVQLLLALGAALVLIAAAFTMLWQQQQAGQARVAALAAETLQTQSDEALRLRGEALAGQLAEAITNPLYYRDLAQIGQRARDVLQQADVTYVLVFDGQGRILQDGSGERPAYGETMADPLAYEAMNASQAHAQWTDAVVDITVPVRIGDKRIGGVRVGLNRATAGAHSAQAADRLGVALADAGRGASTWLLLAFLGFTIAAFALAAFFYRRWAAPLAGLAGDIAHGERTPKSVAMDSARQDEFGEIVRGIRRLREGVSRHDREIRRMAYTDPLTGLSNRLAFREALDERLLTLQASSGELALLFVDLDDFKRINDTLGHEAGDEVLGQLSTRIRLTVERLGAQSIEIARFGGDEFIVLFQNEDIRMTSSRLAEALIEEIQRPLVLGGRQVFLGASVGVTLFPHDATAAGPLLKNADIAMYQAKVAGKNCYRFYSKAMDQAVERRVHLEEELRGAWERGELSLVYQPLLRLADGRWMGAEALMRWRHPKLGMVPPSVFIEVAEQSGLIEQLGRRALNQACADAAAWGLADGVAPFVSVNVSSRQLRTGDLPDVVASALRESGLRPDQLHLELTETAVLGDEALAKALLSRLRATGVKVWLDDFGTGFSGLSHLRRVPVDGVKIDRSFVADVLRDPDDLALTSAIIAMAHSLGITVVAEGIENEGQYAILRERGCDQGQGFWFGRPMPTDELMARFAS